VEVWLVRHAEDLAARAARFGDEGLSERGLVQARELAAALRPLDFESCYSSPLRRAVETARALVEGRTLQVELEPSLAEGSVGALEGLSKEEARRAHPATFRLGSTVVARLAASGHTAPGGETRDAFLARAGRAQALVERLLARSEGCALVVSHGGLLNYLLQLIVALEPRDEVPFGFEYCGVVRILSYREQPGFGPFPMLRFGIP
jgi:broad specificity phosphatase PhoE